MSIYTKLTKKYLLHYKKRTIITLLGMILSIALITSIGIFLTSFEQYANEKSMGENGSYHLKITSVNHQAVKRIQANPQIETVGLMFNETYFLENGEKLELHSIDEEAFSILPFNAIREQNQSGMIIERWVAAELKKLGEIEKPITLVDTEGNEHSFQVKKIVENNRNLQEGQELHAFIVRKSVQIQENMDLYVEIDKRANYKEVYHQILTYIPEKNIKKNYPIIGQDFNDEEVGTITLLSSAGYILPVGIVVLATVAFIFNTFQISITERIREIGLLRTIGATKRQIQKMIVYEIGIIGLVGIPLGLILGVLGFWVILSLYQLTYEETEFSFFYFPMIISPRVFIFSILIGLFSLIISGLLPLKLANRTAPLDVVRRIINRPVFKKRRKHRFLKKILSIETIMAIRNIRRNKLRSFIVIFSISISVFLFLIFSNLLMMFAKTDLEHEIGGEFQIRVYEPARFPESLWIGIENIPDVQGKYIHYDSVYTQMYLPPSMVNQTRADNLYMTTLNGNNFYSESTNISPITEENKAFLSGKLKAGSLKKEKLIQEHGVIYVKAMDDDTSVEVGDFVYIQTQADPSGHLGEIQKVKVSGIVEMDEPESLLLSYPEVVASMGTPTMNRITLYLNDNRDIDEVSKKLDELVAQYPNLEIVNEVEMQRSQSLLIFQIQILLYGFVIVIAFIGLLNIINTTVMNIILRKKEYATLQAVGMSLKSIRNMVMKEGLFYGFISGMIGTAAAGSIEFLLFLLGGRPESTDTNYLYICAFFVIVTICYLTAMLSARQLKSGQWNDALRNE
ncbi:FtsX-like permease family protein [Rossellomorea sp. BNER]|uniref:ABC transporter permease n=1 Tax=Rossellomorea sp. BNER TaxID=2962031 RepID=UPI003AF21AF7|nr:ABC transporter permease [Rossellomorea sp. BNER]